MKAWKKLLSLANKGLENDKDYYFIQGKNPDGNRNLNMESLVDIDNLVDYMLLNFYGANFDWDHHNWIALRNRKNPGTGFQFFAWDQEHVLRELYENTTDEFNANCPSNIFTRLCDNANFKRAFADKVLQYCTNGGVLTPDANRERWMKRSSVLEKAIDAESARWGDYRRDVHRYYDKGDLELYTKDDHWLPARDFMMNEYFEKRTDIFIEQLRDEKLYPIIDAPGFALNGNPVSGSLIQKGDVLEILSDNGKTYYTIDGSDPVSWNGDSGTPSPNAVEYTKSIPLNHSVKINARTYYRSRWSAMRSSFFLLNEEFKDLRLTEIHYHPLADSIDSNEYEFIELKNVGQGTLNLKGLKIADGISFEFENDYTLSSNQFVVLASNEKRFYQRYNKAPSGEFKGNLSNGGETITLLALTGDTIFSFTYNDDTGWPEEADGQGPSIVPKEFNPQTNQSNPYDWRASFYSGGSPFNDDDPDLHSNNEEFMVQKATQLKAFPNPFDQEVTFELKGLNNVNEIVVYNTFGEKLKTIQINRQNNSGRISWNGTTDSGYLLPAGIYICKIRSSEQQLQSAPIRLIKMN